MNGPEHYANAERLVQLSLDQWLDSREGDPMPLAVLTMQQAQVHATLALAAAQAGGTLGLSGVPSREWSEAIS